MRIIIRMKRTRLYQFCCKVWSCTNPRNDRKLHRSPKYHQTRRLQIIYEIVGKQLAVKQSAGKCVVILAGLSIAVRSAEAYIGDQDIRTMESFLWGYCVSCDVKNGVVPRGLDPFRNGLEWWQKRSRIRYISPSSQAHSDRQYFTSLHISWERRQHM